MLRYELIVPYCSKSVSYQVNRKKQLSLEESMFCSISESLTRFSMAF